MPERVIKYFIAVGRPLLSSGRRSSFCEYSEVSFDEWEYSKGEILQQNASFSAVEHDTPYGLKTEYYYSIYNDFEEVYDQYFGYTLDIG